MTKTRPLAATAFAAIVANAGAFAHGGHPVPTGVTTENHLHLTQAVTVSSAAGIALVFACVALGTVLWRKRSAARSQKRS